MSKGFLHKIFLGVVIAGSFASSINSQVNNGDYSNLEIDSISNSIDKALPDTSITANSSAINLPSFLKERDFNSLLDIPMVALDHSGISNRNPFSTIGITTSGDKPILPSDIRFTGIAEVGKTKGVVVSSSLGVNILQIGEVVSNGYKIIGIDTDSAKISLSNGSVTKTISLELD